MEKKEKDIKPGDPGKITLKKEDLHVEKEKIETGRVKISKKVLKEEIPINLQGYVEDVEIKRKKINRLVKSPGPAVRKEGEATVYSLYKEVYVKQVMLEEEVWISKKKIKKSFKGKEELKREVLDVERTRGRSRKEKPK